jgi:flagellar hook-basal body complex protein FliE
MSDATISSILSQIRGMQAQTAFRPSASEAVESTQNGGFGESLRKAIGQIDNDQKQAQNLATRFELGDPDASLTKVMMAQQTAQLSFRATVEMRNRIVQAYQDVMNMPM